MQTIPKPVGDKVRSSSDNDLENTDWKAVAIKSAADLAALREALRDLAAMADGQRQTFNELWEVVETLRPGRDLGGDAAVIRGGYLSIADKARAVLSRTERRSA